LKLLGEENITNELIFVSDVQLPVLAVNFRKMFKELCNSGKINRFDKGVYYIPKQSRLKGGVPLGADEDMEDASLRVKTYMK